MKNHAPLTLKQVHLARFRNHQHARQTGALELEVLRIENNNNKWTNYELELFRYQQVLSVMKTLNRDGVFCYKMLLKSRPNYIKLLWYILYSK